MAKPIRSYKKSRVCRHMKCKQKLSIYNPEPYCYIHHQHASAKGATEELISSMAAGLR